MRKIKTKNETLLAGLFVLSTVAGSSYTLTGTSFADDEATDPATNCPATLRRSELIDCLQQDRRVEVKIDYAPDAQAELTTPQSTQAPQP